MRVSAGKLRGENRGCEAPSWKIQEKAQIRRGKGKSSLGHHDGGDEMQQRRASRTRGKEGSTRCTLPSRFSLCQRGLHIMNKYVEVSKVGASTIPTMTVH